MRRWLQALLILVLLLAPLPAGAQTPEVTRQNPRRTPWTTSKMVGTPDPPAPYRVAPVFGDRKFDRPVVLTNWPVNDQLFVAEQGGKLLCFDPEQPGDRTELVVDLKKELGDFSNLYGLTFHPQVRRNRQLFVTYTKARSGDNGTRVSRFKLGSLDPPRLDPSSEEVLLTWRAGGHNGGCLKFGPDGYLYISTGDASGPSPPDQYRAGQNIGNLLSAILRIDVDQLANGQPYVIPQDNPFVQQAGARGEIWSYGYRNPWKMSFDRKTGDLWVGDVGWELWELIYRVQKGGNYGWSIMEGSQQVVLPEQQPGPTPILPPTIEHPHSEAASITGGFVYRGQRWKDLVGAYIYGDYQSGIVWSASLQNREVMQPRELAQSPLQIAGFGEDNAGELYLLDYQGRIYELQKNNAADSSGSFPNKLSETGLFQHTARHDHAAGVVPYSINTPAWFDGADANRLLAVPGNEPITLGEKGRWKFPEGSVIAKTVTLDNVVRPAEQSDQPFRIETQILHHEQGSWRAYTYVWNNEQTDAQLAGPDGLNRKLKVRGPSGVVQRTYRVAGRKQCVLCHNPWVESRTTIFGVQSASLLGFSAEQLKRDHAYPLAVASQLETLTQLGLLNIGDSAKKTQPLVDPYDSSAKLSDRVRSYLQVNCAHCHQFNAGGVATIALSRDVALKDTRMVDVRPTQGTFGISGARIIAPGDPQGSVLLYRIAKLGGGRMPRLGSHEVDDRAVRLIHDWIETMTPAGSLPAKLPDDQTAALADLRERVAVDKRAAALSTLTASTRSALVLAQRIAAGGLSEPVRLQAVQLASRHERSEIRDLFERFVPAADRVQRLGSVVNQAEILAMPADAHRGQQVFVNHSAAACKNCHKIGDLGEPEAIGPDLTKIGKKYSRNQLLQQILVPSQFIEPKYVPYVLETSDGRILSGLIVTKTDDKVVLRDAKNKTHSIPATGIERLVRQRKSLMPDLLLRDLTRQQVADLLAYLASLK